MKKILFTLATLFAFAASAATNIQLVARTVMYNPTNMTVIGPTGALVFATAPKIGTNRVATLADVAGGGGAITNALLRGVNEDLPETAFTGATWLDGSAGFTFTIGSPLSSGGSSGNFAVFTGGGTDGGGNVVFSGQTGNQQPRVFSAAGFDHFVFQGLHDFTDPPYIDRYFLIDGPDLILTNGSVIHGDGSGLWSVSATNADTLSSFPASFFRNAQNITNSFSRVSVSSSGYSGLAALTVAGGKVPGSVNADGALLSIGDANGSQGGDVLIASGAKNGGGTSDGKVFVFAPGGMIVTGVVTASRFVGDAAGLTNQAAFSSSITGVVRRINGVSPTNSAGDTDLSGTFFFASAISNYTRIVPVPTNYTASGLAGQVAFGWMSGTNFFFWYDSTSNRWQRAKAEAWQ